MIKCFSKWKTFVFWFSIKLVRKYARAAFKFISRDCATSITWVSEISYTLSKQSERYEDANVFIRRIQVRIVSLAEFKEYIVVVIIIIIANFIIFCFRNCNYGQDSFDGDVAADITIGVNIVSTHWRMVGFLVGQQRCVVVCGVWCMVHGAWCVVCGVW